MEMTYYRSSQWYWGLRVLLCGLKVSGEEEGDGEERQIPPVLFSEDLFPFCCPRRFSTIFVGSKGHGP